MMQHQQTPHAQAAATAAPPQPIVTAVDAPPKQVALAIERLVQAGRLIADIRLGADRLLEALFVTAQPHQSTKPIHLFEKEDASMRRHLQDLRSIGRQLEESGVLNESLRSRSNLWGLHMPLVCPDGAVVAYAWKRQLAGQAGASAVDRTRLALKAFTDQKRRFFPHLCDVLNGQSSIAQPPLKKYCHSLLLTDTDQEELSNCKTLPDILSRLEKEVPNVKVSTYQRLDWLKRASSLSCSFNESSIEASKEPSFHSATRLRTAQVGAVAEDNKVSVIELLFPSIFRAIVSLHPAGSTEPDALAFFSPDEGGSYVHARGSSAYHVFRHITDYAAMALQYFLGIRSETALSYLLHWICRYQNLFSEVCSKCGKLLSMDQQLALFLPPVYRPYQQIRVMKTLSQQTSSTKDQKSGSVVAYHIGCFTEEAKLHTRA